MRIARFVSRFTALLAGLALAGGVARACPPEGGFEGARALPSSAAELRLEDGRMVKLAGLHVPQAAEADALLALRRHIEGSPLTILPIAEAPDRYGRTLARVLARGLWIEGSLVAEGLALASTAPGEIDCLAVLLSAERRARAARRGIWSIGTGPVLDARDGAALAARRGQFVVAEGAIISVGVRDYGTFLNFARRGAEGLSVLIARTDRARIERALGSLAELRGKRARVRGVLDPSGAPLLRIARAEAIERVD